MVAGKTCADLKAAFPDMESGHYYLDPNEGNAADAILAFCNMATGETCVFPTPLEVPRPATASRTPSQSYSAQTEKKSWVSGEPGYRWFSELEGGFEVTHLHDPMAVEGNEKGRPAVLLQDGAGADDPASAAKQQGRPKHHLPLQEQVSPTFRPCPYRTGRVGSSDSVAYYDAENQHYLSALKLMSANDVELVAGGYPKFTYTSLNDGCRVAFLSRLGTRWKRRGRVCRREAGSGRRRCWSTGRTSRCACPSRTSPSTTSAATTRSLASKLDLSALLRMHHTQFHRRL